jgi:hypothetical protein
MMIRPILWVKTLIFKNRGDLFLTLILLTFLRVFKFSRDKGRNIPRHWRRAGLSSFAKKSDFIHYTFRMLTLLYLCLFTPLFYSIMLDLYDIFCLTGPAPGRHSLRPLSSWRPLKMINIRSEASLQKPKGSFKWKAHIWRDRHDQIQSI